MKTIFSILLLFLVNYCVAQRESKVETTDITNFWIAYDRLALVSTLEDSVFIMQTLYIDQATPGFEKFIKARDFTAKEYIALLRTYPLFWASIRPATENIASRKDEVDNVLNSLAAMLPDFKRPEVCFAIGCLRTGGTTTKGLILVGAEIAASDRSTNTAELGSWLKSVIGQSGDIVSMVAHEAIHTQQSGFPVPEIFSLIKHKKLSLLNMSIVEGSCDFLTMQCLGLNINSRLYDYGQMYQTALFEEFREDLETNPFDYRNWLYNGNLSKDRPADLGYYIGYKITEAYYLQAPHKTKAIKTILKIGRYKKVYKQSGLAESSKAAE